MLPHTQPPSLPPLKAGWEAVRRKQMLLHSVITPDNMASPFQFACYIFSIWEWLIALWFCETNIQMLAFIGAHCGFFQRPYEGLFEENPCLWSRIWGSGSPSFQMETFPVSFPLHVLDVFLYTVLLMGLFSGGQPSWASYWQHDLALATFHITHGYSCSYQTTWLKCRLMSTPS